MRYKSQVEQDKFLNEKVFKGLRGGVFLDLGAFDGVYLSNTYFFEKSLGWKGYCFEPIPKYFKELEKKRSSKNYDVCIGDKDYRTKFTIVNGHPTLSGISKNIDVNKLKKSFVGIGKKEVIECDVIDIDKFLRNNRVREIHYLSLDTEGNEEKILKRIDYNKTFIHSISVECEPNEKDIEEFLETKGFVLLKHTRIDKIFVNKDSKFYPKKDFWLLVGADAYSLLYSPMIRYILKHPIRVIRRIKNAT